MLPSQIENKLAFDSLICFKIHVVMVKYYNFNFFFHFSRVSRWFLCYKMANPHLIRYRTEELPVDPPRPQECRIDKVGSRGRCEDEHLTCEALDAIQLSQELVDNTVCHPCIVVASSEKRFRYP